MERLKEVDWSKAPKGATHYNEERSRPWLRDVPASFYYDGHWINYTSYNDYGKDHFSNAVKRPQERDVSDVCEPGCNPAAANATLRDQFAMAALHGIMANPSGPIQSNGMSGWGWCNCSPSDVTNLVYSMADEMLKEREK